MVKFPRFLTGQNYAQLPHFLKAGNIVAVSKVGNSIAEGLSGNMGPITFGIVQKYVDCVMLVEGKTSKRGLSALGL